MDGNKLSSLSAPDGKTLADHVALNIGLLGENMTLKRAVLISANGNTLLSGQFDLALLLIYENGFASKALDLYRIFSSCS